MYSGAGSPHACLEISERLWRATVASELHKVTHGSIAESAGPESVAIQIMEKEGPQAASMSQGSGDFLEKYVRFCGDTYRMDKVVKAVRSVPRFRHSLVAALFFGFCECCWTSY
jgi:hypothetical protein